MYGQEVLKSAHMRQTPQNWSKMYRSPVNQHPCEQLLNHIMMMVKKLTEMKTMYKPNSRRSMTVPTICHSCAVLDPWQCCSTWRWMALRCVLSFLSSSIRGSLDGLSEAIRPQMPRNSFGGGVPAFIAGNNKKQEQRDVVMLLPPSAWRQELTK